MPLESKVDSENISDKGKNIAKTTGIVVGGIAGSSLYAPYLAFRISDRDPFEGVWWGTVLAIASNGLINLTAHLTGAGDSELLSTYNTVALTSTLVSYGHIVLDTVYQIVKHRTQRNR